METDNYNMHNEILNLKTIKLNIPIVYEIIKKYVAKIKLENI